VGFFESSSTPPGFSLQRVGAGASPSGFDWQAPAPASPGQINSGQNLVGMAGTLYGEGSMGALGIPAFCSVSPPRAGEILTLVASNLPGFTPTFMAISAKIFSPPFPLGDGLILNVGLPLLILSGLSTDLTGHAILSVPVPANAGGVTIYCQAVALGGAGGLTFAASTGLQLAIL